MHDTQWCTHKLLVRHLGSEVCNGVLGVDYSWERWRQTHAYSRRYGHTRAHARTHKHTLPDTRLLNLLGGGAVERQRERGRINIVFTLCHLIWWIGRLLSEWLFAFNSTTTEDKERDLDWNEKTNCRSACQSASENKRKTQSNRKKPIRCGDKSGTR